LRPLRLCGKILNRKDARNHNFRLVGVLSSTHVYLTTLISKRYYQPAWLYLLHPYG